MDRIKANSWIAGRSYAFVIAGESMIRRVEQVRFTANNRIFSQLRFKYFKVTLMNDWSDRHKKRHTVRLCNFSTRASRREHSC